MSIELHTTYLGLKLANPLVVAPCPLTGNLDVLQRLEEAGAAAVVLPSLFEEQIEHEELQIQRLHEYAVDSFGEALSYFPELEDYNTGPENYLQHLAEAKRRLKIPVIASLNGYSSGGWMRYARLLEKAGADALELNIYHVATDPEVSGIDVEAQYCNLVAAVCASVKIPVAVKLGPFFTSLPHFARKITNVGARGLVLFNRFLQPDIDLQTLQVSPNLVLSTSHELRLPLRWIAIMRGRILASLAASTGVHGPHDAMKLLLAGADAVMTASALLRHGPGFLQTLLTGITDWMEEKEYQSVEQLKGSMSQLHCPDPAAFERANYMKALASYTGEFI